MRIIVPEDLGGELRVLNGTCHVILEKISFGKSRKNQPKVTFKYLIDQEMEGEENTIGEAVLETFSLQPQALFKLNEVYIQVTGERLPMGEFSEEEFTQMLNETLTGREFNLYLEAQIPADGSSTEERTTVVRREVA